MIKISAIGFFCKITSFLKIFVFFFSIKHRMARKLSGGIIAVLVEKNFLSVIKVRNIFWSLWLQLWRTFWINSWDRSNFFKKNLSRETDSKKRRSITRVISQQRLFLSPSSRLQQHSINFGSLGPGSNFVLVVAVVAVVGEFAAEDVLVELLDRLRAAVQSLHATRETLARRQVDVLQGLAVLQQPREGLQVDRAAAAI